MHFIIHSSRMTECINFTRIQRGNSNLRSTTTYFLYQKALEIERRMLNSENIFILFCPKLFTIQLERNLSCSIAILGMPPLVMQEVKTPDQAIYLLIEIFPSQICQ